ncbi:Msl2237 protein [hydrothermal vent metagenome]|uniref:Msl2237 protein n=1 Tax=hydrothermal vent metagenome TaxID=652676 RepID=A0A3B0XIJ7_9ZZZZ
MRDTLKKKIVEVCNAKISTKGVTVGLSFYAFFANKNDDPDLLMEAAHWWIMQNKLDHFEKAVKIKKLVESAG